MSLFRGCVGAVLLLLAVASAMADRADISLACSRDVAPSDRIQLQVNTTNLPVIHLTASPMDGRKWLKTRGFDEEAGNDDGKRPAPRTIGGPVASWTARIADLGQEPNPNNADTFYSRQTHLPYLRPGVYLIRGTAGNVSGWCVVNVTNLAVVVKRSPKRMLVWVTDAVRGGLKPGSRVVVVKKSGDVAAEGTAGADGALVLPLAPGPDVVLVSNGPDLAGLMSDATNPDGQLVADFQTDRPIYRAGQTVSFKAILRRTLGLGYSVVANRKVSLEVRDPKDDVVDRRVLTTNAMGSIVQDFEIPGEAMTGSYSLVVKDGDDQVSDSFEVAEYRKPEFQVSVTPVKKRYLAGEKVEFLVQATYYFGAPVPKASVHYLARISPDYFEPRRWRGYDDGNLYPRDTYQANQVNAEDTVETDKDGRAVIALNTPRTDLDVDYSVDATVTDASRRQVSASGSVPVYAAAKRIGLSTDVLMATLGSLIPLDIHVVDLDGSPATAHVHLETSIREWDEAKEELVERKLVQTQVLVPPTGKLRYSIPARSEGTITVRAWCEDGSGRKASASLYLYVAGNYGRSLMRQQVPTVGIRLDRPTYTAGANAHAYATTNNPGRPMLLVAEGQDIWSYKVVNPSRAGQLWTVATSRKMEPNAEVTAFQWVEGRPISGSETLLVPASDRHLAVSVIPDRKQYRPGDKANVTVRVRDQNGRPLRAEISLAVVDESIFAVSPDATPDPYDTFWSPRGNLVSMETSAPEELSGGAYQAAAPGGGAKIRSRFVDTALWAGTVDTNASGEAHLSFEVPGNLTTWRATACGIDLDSSGGKGMSTVLANRPVMLRLATPRQLVVGDKLTMIGTVNNRTDAEHAFRVRLSSQGAALQGAAVQTVKVEAKGEGHVEWTLNPTQLPADGMVTLTGDVVATDHPTADFGDALRLSVPVVPKAVQERILKGGVLGKSASFTVRLPADRAEPASVVDVLIQGGLADVQRQTADELLKSPRYCTPIAIDQLAVAAAMHLPGDRKEVRESMAMLARDQNGQGWGWWEGGQASASITARGLRSLADASRAGLPVYKNMADSAVSGAESLYAQMNLWDSRALLAASLTEAGSKKGPDMLEEVLRRGEDLSPFARLRLAEAERLLKHPQEARKIVSEVLKLASVAPDDAYIPVGEGVGWTASTAETTAEALVVLVRLRMDASLQAKLARWLALSGETDWRTFDEQAATVRALSLYGERHPSASSVGPVSLSVNGTPVPTTPLKVGEGATAHVPRSLLRDGENRFVLGRQAAGETFYSVDARVFVPRLSESTRGVRVLRRIEVQNAAGMWGELNRAVKAGEPVRITMVAWGDELPDALRVLDPIPAGFEFVSDESESYGREEVRDAAVIHYLQNDGSPQTFRYYIRAESEGRLNLLPARVEFLRRPATSGQSNAVVLSVTEGSKE